MRVFGCVFKMQPNGFKLHPLPRQALISVSLASADCAPPPAEGGCGGRLRAWRLLCSCVSPSPSPAPHGAPAAAEAKVWCGVVLRWAWGNTAASGCGRGVLATLLFLPEKRREERRHFCVVQGMILQCWFTKQLSQLVRPLLL